MLSALIFSVGSVLACPLLRAYSPALVSGITTLGGGIVLVAGALALEPGAGAALSGRWDGAAWASWCFLVLFGSLVAYAALLHLVREWGASRAGSYAFISPIIAVLLGVLAFGETVTIRAALHRLDLSWKKAKTLLGRANPERREAFIAQLRPLLAGAQRDRHRLVYLDEAHIHQDVDLGHGWGERGKRFHVASSSPGLSAKVSLSGLSLYNEGQVRLWPYPRANGEHTVEPRGSPEIEVLRRLRAEVPDGTLTVIWDGAPYHRAKAVWAAAASLDITLMPLPGYSPDLMPVEPLWRWLREDVTYHHCHATAEDLTRRVAAFEAMVNQNSHAVADRLWVKNHLNPNEEELRFSN